MPFTVTYSQQFSKAALEALQTMLGKNIGIIGFKTMSIEITEDYIPPIYAGFEFIRFIFFDENKLHNYTLRQPSFIFPVDKSGAFIDVEYEQIQIPLGDFSNIARKATSNISRLLIQGGNNLISKIYIIHTYVTYIDHRCQTLNGTSDEQYFSAPKQFDYLVRVHDYWSFLVFECLNGEKLIIERSDTPNTYLVYWNNPEKWTFIIDSWDDESQTPMYKIMHTLD